MYVAFLPRTNRETWLSRALAAGQVVAPGRARLCGRAPNASPAAPKNWGGTLERGS